MRTNKIVDFLVSITTFPVLPLQLVSTTLLGCLVTISFGLLLIPINAIWFVFFYAPLYLTSSLWSHVPILRIPVAIVGIPLAVLGNTFACMMPSMGDTKGRTQKLIYCQVWPFSAHFMEFIKGAGMDGELDRILLSLGLRNPVINSYVVEINTEKYGSPFGPLGA